MNNKNEIGNEKNGIYIINPTMPPPPKTSFYNTPIKNTNDHLENILKQNEKYVIDNDVLYKKLLDLEGEIKAIKEMISSICHSRPNYIQPFMNSDSNLANRINNQINPGIPSYYYKT